MRALLTGVTGFVGSHLARVLLADGVEVHAVVRTGAHLERIAALGPDLRLHVDEGGGSLDDAVGAARPDVAFHLATRFVTRHVPGEVGDLVADNVTFGTRLAEALVGSGATLVNTGTAWQHVDGAAYAPKNLYAATKQAFEDVLVHYRRNAGLATVTVNLFDTYGPDDHRPKLIAALVGAVRSGEALAMTSGDQLIDLVHVDDVVAALRLAVTVAADQAGPGAAEVGPFGAGSGAPRTIREVVEVLGRVAGRPVPVRWGERPDGTDDMRTPWDAGPPVPGWAPVVPLDEGLAALLGAGDGSASR